MSRRNQQFNHDALSQELVEHGIDYRHIVALGGRRPPVSDSPNTALTNAGFRGYADYMETEDFQKGVARLLEVARAQNTAIMCSEAVWWRCHRSMISDYLKANGIEVIHIMAPGKSQAHPFTSAAAIVNGRLSYRGVLESGR